MKPDTRHEPGGSTKPRRARRLRLALMHGLLLALCLCAPRPAASQTPLGAELGLGEAIARIDHARGPALYPALRSLWRSWDRSHPDQVESALRLIQGSKKLSAAQRVYAKTLTAYARMRRGDLSEAERALKALGFVDQWLFVGPFDNEGKAGYDLVFEPERELSKAIVQGRAFDGKERPVRWRKLPSVFRYGWVDVGTVARPENAICAYLATFVQDQQAKQPRPISVWVGSGGAFKLFWNGRQVLADKAYRGHDVDRFAATVNLVPGINSMVLKVCGDEAAPVVSVRLADAGGEPDSALTTSSEFETVAPSAADSAQPTKSLALGAVQQFDGWVSRPHASPADLEDYARYLVLTNGDDNQIHQARDLAKRSAEKAPTVARLLLAGQLAEDRNQRARWIEKAVARLPKEPERMLDASLAQGQLARESVNWRDALPFYDRALALDPDNTEALRGKVELYNEAGLKRTALELLQRAAERNPHSLALLNMLASQLRAIGYAVKASEVEARYAAFRFDDRGYLSAHTDVALARRERGAAEHWIQRLLQLEPDQLWTYAASARAYRALGQVDRALASYQAAREIAPEEVSVLQALSDLHGELGQRQQQRSLLQQVLQLRPQAKEVREYIEHIEPEKPRPDEALAQEPSQFLEKRALQAAGHDRRTLLDLNVTTVFENGLSSKFRQVVFQPLTDSAAALTRQYAFAYEADRQEVQLRGARVFRADGRIDEAIESGEGAANDPSIAMYTSARTFYVQFPRLEPGDVVELRYRIDDVTPRNEFADYFGEVVYLQGTEPVSHAEYVLIAPKSRKIFIDHRGIPGLHTQRSELGNTVRYRFFASDVPQVVPEPEMPPWTEVLGFVHVSTFDSYATLGKWYWGLSREQLDLDDETRKLAREIARGKHSTLDKVKAVYNWVIRNTRYVALEFGIYGYKPRRCVQTVARGWGDCKDKATVIVSLLKELGIEATLVVVRTGLRGNFDSKVASLAPFDHAIAYVPSLDLYLDGTAEHTGSAELPAMDLGAMGVRINQGNAQVVRLPSNDPRSNVRRREVTAVVNADGSASLSLSYAAHGSGAAEWRKRYHAQATFKERVVQDLANEHSGFQLTSAKAHDLEDFEKPAALTIHGQAPQFARKEGDSLSITVTPTLRLTPVYASLSRRKLPISIPAFSTIDDRFTIKVPRGMRVISGPSAVNEQSEFGSYALQVEQAASEITVTSRLALTATRIEPGRYAAWRDFCKRVDAAFLPRLVVGKP